MLDPEKETVRTLQKIEDHLDDIARSLALIAKVQNKKVPVSKPSYSQPSEEFEEDVDDDD